MTGSTSARAREFHDLHTREGCFLLPNAWDAGSAKILQAAGFKAIATTSAGIAFSFGAPDHGLAADGASARVDRTRMLGRVAEIAEAIELPLSADLEDGYGTSPDTVAETISLAITAGAVGGNIEDYTGDESEPLLPFNLAVERIRAARVAADASAERFVLVARTDCFLVEHGDPLTESIRRGNAFVEAGADCVFVPGASDARTIGRLVSEIDAPLNVVMGLTGNRLTLAELAKLGVRRVTIGGSLARAGYQHLWDAAREMVELGSFSYAERQISQDELNRIFLSGCAESSAE